jgi:hypothetical protein
MKELDFYVYTFSDGTIAPFEINGKKIIGIWLVFNK